MPIGAQGGTSAGRYSPLARPKDGTWKRRSRCLFQTSCWISSSTLERRGQCLPGSTSRSAFRSPMGRRRVWWDFPSALLEFGTGQWDAFYSVADLPSELSLRRPFYPRRSSAEARQAHLLSAHAAASIGELRRRCEHATSGRGAACALFWTLGGNQVGKAAIAGWQEVIAPARRRGARLWPFDGELQELAATNGLVLAETYPAEAYGHVGIRFSAGQSKRRQDDRASQSRAILKWAERSGVRLSPKMADMVQGGFGEDSAGEDRFDAALGLCGMIEVAKGRRPDAPRVPEVRQWEGWILGQAA
jgi:hypothetical protein